MRRSWLTGILTGAIVGVAAFAFTESIQAQGGRAPGGRIACVNVGTLFNEYQRRKDLLDEMNELQENLKQEELQRRQKIDALTAELDALDPDDPTARDRMGELMAMQIDYKNWGDLKQAHMARELGLWSVKIYREILKAVAELAEREGYDFVFYHGEFEPESMDFQVIMDQIRDHKLLYAHPSVDLTQTVLDKLNNDYRAQPRSKMLYVP